MPRRRATAFVVSGDDARRSLVMLRLKRLTLLTYLALCGSLTLFRRLLKTFSFI